MNRNNRKRPADTQEAAWVAGEDKFVLQQAKKRAAIRVKEGRAKPIDRLAVTLRCIEPQRNPFDDEVEDADLDIVDPQGVFEGLNDTELRDLEKDIDVYASLETNQTSKDFWHTMDIICKDRRQRLGQRGPQGRAQDSVAPEVDKLFSSKSFQELEALEKQIRAKLKSNEPIDEEYWENLLVNLLSWKARSKLRQVSEAIIESQLVGLRQQQEEEANRVRNALSALVTDKSTTQLNAPHPQDLDPEASLKVRMEDKQLEIQDESSFLEKVAAERKRVRSLGFVPSTKERIFQQEQDSNARSVARASESLRPGKSGTGSSDRNDEFSQATAALYQREVARGVSENEEIFAGEESVTTGVKPQWANKYRPRKPRYFNRVQMGYEWNKYNQTHYDHDHPPPKVVQGYKFNIFYPDLIDKTRAPTYKIERENGRKRGQSFARAGEEDTCLIRFVSGPPYEDIAFRIVDKEWDYSAKRERGFKSSFDKGILQLHFQFKKIFYRK